VQADELDAIERALGVRLPPAYRSAAEAGRLQRLLNADPTSVVAINRAFRAGEFGDRDWPHHIVAFADDGGGNHFCLDLSAPATSRVLCRDHETLELVAEADDFERWLESI
jgi:hypothetical protein